MTDRIVVRGGFVLSMSSGPNDGRLDVLIEGGRISAIDTCIPSDGATVINAEGCIVMPGLIDAHRHLWYTALRAETMDHTISDLAKGLWPGVGGNITPDDIYSATRAGIVDALNMGITTVMDYCHAVNTDEHAERAIDAHLGLPGRALFAYGPSIAQKMKEFSGETPVTAWSHAVEVQKRLGECTRMSLALAVQGPFASGRSGFEHDLGTARDMGVPITAHIASVAGGPTDGEIRSLDEWGLLGPDMQFIHCTGSSDHEFARLRECGVQVAVSPMAELFLGMGVPPLTRMRRAGLTPAISADAVIGSSGDLFEEARAGLMAARGAAISEVISRGSPVSNKDQLEMTTMDAVASITSRAAAAVFMSDSIGTLEVGKKADLIAVSHRGFEPATAEEAASLLVGTCAASDVNAVVVDGVVVKEHGRLVDIDTQSIRDELAKTRRKMKSYFS
ncbi:amidohydrolase family protein [Caballeronia sp. GAFFF1]|uniref:amidohydrolase family protein n=1 Tax=Caballeronia sp. GAFFF1 TaxID=2921779 RepID=UPI002027985B|nr:amidohydrolase family protein [Caballeronia sp. GAFFF1]